MGNYLGAFVLPENMRRLRAQLSHEIIILESLWVEEEEQGKGKGTQLVKEFLKAVPKCLDVVVIADTREDRRVQKFYKKLGFKKILSTPSGPLMKLIR